MSSDDFLTSAGPGGVYRSLDDTHWERLLKAEVCFGVGGTRSDEMFFGSVDGKLFHYNGSGVKEIEWPWGIKYKQITNVVVIHDRIYILATSIQNNDAYLMRGRRTNGIRVKKPD